MSLAASPCSLVSKNHVRPDVRHARDDLHQVVHALHVDRRLRLGPGHDLAKRRAIVDERTLQHRRDLEALGHDVVGDELAARRPRPAPPRASADRRTSRIHGLSARTWIPPLTDARMRSIFTRVPAREDDDVAGTLLEHALEVVGARVHLEIPRGRTLGAAVESGDAVQVLEEVPAERRVDVHARRHARVHLFLDRARRGSGPGRASSGAHRPPPHAAQRSTRPPRPPPAPRRTIVEIL